MNVIQENSLCAFSHSMVPHRIENLKILASVDNRHEKLNENQPPSLSICEVNGKLVPLEKVDTEFIPSEMSLEKALFTICKRPKRGDGVSIQSILLHHYFELERFLFIEQALSLDENGVPNIFQFSNAACADIIDVGSDLMYLNPLQIADIHTKKNLLVHAAQWMGGQKRSDLLLQKLIQKFPSEFFSYFYKILEAILFRIEGAKYASQLVQVYEEMGGCLNSFYQTWFLTSQCQKPSHEFDRIFSDLSTYQKENIYKYAYFYNNPFIYKKLSIEIPENLYSLNFMWINKTLKYQEYLFGDGLTPMAQKCDFQNRFIKPIIKWAQKNPNTAINIWYDSTMTYFKTLKASQEIFFEEAPQVIHPSIYFRDVRELNLVRENPEIFKETIPVYFRVDLLRGIIADQILKNREVRYFVYGDLDMKSIKRQQLFDERTTKYLTDFGFVMAKVQTISPGFENGFQILNGNHSEFLHFHRKIIVDLNIELAQKNPLKIEEQQIFHCYPAMFTCLLEYLGGYGQLHESLFNEISNEEKTKLYQYRFGHFKLKENRFLPLGSQSTEIRKIFPTKPVRLPPSHFE